jgi:hypothetical protein
MNSGVPEGWAVYIPSEVESYPGQC